MQWDSGPHPAGRWGQSWVPKGVAMWEVGGNSPCGVKLLVPWGLVGQFDGGRPCASVSLHHLAVGTSCAQAAV